MVAAPRSTSLRWALAALSGFLNGAAFVYLGGFALLANVPLLHALRGCPRASMAAGLGALVGFLGGVHIYGVLDYGWLIFWGFSFYTASQMVLYALIVRGLWGRAGPWFDVALPALVWTLTEWVRTVGPLSMPASYVGCIADVSWLRPWLALAAVTGGLGVSTLVALAQSVLFHALISPRTHRAPILAAVALLAAVGAWGALAPPAMGERALRVAGVQGGLPNHAYAAAVADARAMRDVVAVYEALTRRAYASGADLVVWPETAIRGPVLTDPDLRRRLLPPAGAPSLLVAGLPVDDASGRGRNVAVAVAPGGAVIDTYTKVRLVPNHERHFVPGADWVPLKTPLGRLGVLICLESVYPDAGRGTAANGAEIILIMSNDAGFRRSPIAHHMTNRAIVRAVENGRWVVRVGQAGISAVIDPAGRVHRYKDLFEPGLLYGTVRLRDDLTPYTRFGDWWVIVMALGLLGPVYAGRRRSRRRPAA